MFLHNLSLAIDTSTSCFFLAELYVYSRPSFFKLTHNFIKICHNLLAQSPIWEHLGSFQSYLIINKAITYPFVILHMWEFIC